MGDYRQERNKREKTGMAAGAAVAVGLHAAVVLLGSFSGFTYIYPPPQEQTFLIDFSQEPEKKPVRQEFQGREPVAETIDKSKPVELVQASQAQEKGTKSNEVAEAKVDDFGDVEKPEPPREKPIDKRALFSAADNSRKKDSLAAQTASKVSDALKAGHAQGNTENGKTVGEPNARVKGRSSVGVLPKPAYNVQEEGTVVVNIIVDQYGQVISATADGDGTTITNAKLLNEARKAALGARFNQSADAPVQQAGTITYHFKLK